MSTSKLMDITRTRPSTDIIMPVWLPFIGYLIAIIGVLTTVAGMAMRRGMASAAVGSFGTLLIVVGAIINVYVIYKWIDRRNKHFRRSHEFFREIERILDKMGSPRAERISSILREMELEEQHKSPAVWVILSLLVPLVILYVFYFLTRDFYQHSVREAHLVEEAEKGLEELGSPLPSRKYRPLPERNAVIYAVLTLLTGIFGVYWVYVLTKDPNEHFREHALYEDELVASLEKTLA